MSQDVHTRRLFVKRAMYVAPAVLTLPAAAAYAKHGSEKPGSQGRPSPRTDGKPGKQNGWHKDGWHKGTAKHLDDRETSE